MNGRSRSHVSPLAREVDSAVTLADRLLRARGLLLVIMDRWKRGKALFSAQKSKSCRKLSEYGSEIGFTDEIHFLLFSYPGVPGFSGKEEGGAGQVTVKSHQRGEGGHVSDSVSGSIKGDRCVDG